MVQYWPPSAHRPECARRITATPRRGGPLTFCVRAHLMPGARTGSEGLPVGGLGQTRAEH